MRMRIERLGVNHTMDLLSCFLLVKMFINNEPIFGFKKMLIEKILNVLEEKRE